MNEVWRDIVDFPTYAVSNFGRVLNKETDVIKIQSMNQQGIPSVLLMANRRQHRRATAVLVAEAFLPKPKQRHFNTPINLDGDRTNNHVDNLAWRPRWFAIKYHQQFTGHREGGFKQPIKDKASGQIYATSFDAATQFGLLDVDIFTATLNRTTVFPTWQQFEVVDI